MYGQDDFDDSVNLIVLYVKNQEWFIDLLVFYNYGDHDGTGYDDFGYCADVVETMNPPPDNNAFMCFYDALRKCGFETPFTAPVSAYEGCEDCFVYVVNQTEYFTDETRIIYNQRKPYYYNISDEFWFVDEQLKHDFIMAMTEIAVV